jgi:molecular chaperone GrpE
MVSVLENLKRASESIPAELRSGNEALANLGAGVDLTMQELLSTFERYGIVRLDPIGQKFDHNFHQAIAQVERMDVEEGTVVQVVQAGYMIAGRLLRPAMVAVSKSAADVKKVDTTA